MAVSKIVANFLQELSFFFITVIRREYILSPDWPTAGGSCSQVGFSSTFNHRTKTKLSLRQLENEVVLFKQQMQQQHAIDRQKREVEAANLRAQEQEANNWRETALIRTQQATLENQSAVIKRDKELLENRDRQLRLLEDQRRRNRFVMCLKAVTSEY